MQKNEQVDISGIKSYSSSNKVKVFFKEKLSYIILIVGCLIFIFHDAIKWGFNDANIFVLLGSIAVTYAFNLYVNFTCGKIGRKRGKSSPEWIATQQYYSKAKEDITEIRSYLPFYCDYKTEYEKKIIQREILENENLSIAKLDYYTKEKLTDDQWKAVVNARKVKVIRLQAKDLVSERGKSKKNKDGNYLGKSEHEFDKENKLINALTKLLIPMVLTYLTLESLVFANILSGVLKVVIILFGAIYNLFINEEFTINELRNRFINKADCLIEFKSLYENDKTFKQKIELERIKDEQELEEMKRQFNLENDIVESEEELQEEVNINKVFENCINKEDLEENKEEIKEEEQE